MASCWPQSIILTTGDQTVIIASAIHLYNSCTTSALLLVYRLVTYVSPARYRALVVYARNARLPLYTPSKSPRSSNGEFLMKTCTDTGEAYPFMSRAMTNHCCRTSEYGNKCFFFIIYILDAQNLSKATFYIHCASLWHCTMEKFITWLYMPNDQNFGIFLFSVHHFSNVECPLDSCHRLIWGCRNKISEVIYQLTHKIWVAFVCIHDDDIRLHPLAPSGIATHSMTLPSSTHKRPTDTSLVWFAKNL